MYFRYFKNLFSRLLRFVKSKMFGKDKEREVYWKVSKDVYELKDNKNLFHKHLKRGILLLATEDYMYSFVIVSEL